MDYERTEGWVTCDRIKELVANKRSIPFSLLYLMVKDDSVKASWREYLSKNDYEQDIASLSYKFKGVK